MENRMQPIRLLKSYRLYNAGEIAGFKSKEAAYLISNGIGEVYKTRNVSKKQTTKAKPKNTSEK